jgi:hypothetical protein
VGGGWKKTPEEEDVVTKNLTVRVVTAASEGTDDEEHEES